MLALNNTIVNLEFPAALVAVKGRPIPVAIGEAALNYAGLFYHEGLEPGVIQVGPGLAFDLNVFPVQWGGKFKPLPVVFAPDLRAGHIRIEAGTSWNGYVFDT